MASKERAKDGKPEEDLAKLEANVYGCDWAASLRVISRSSESRDCIRKSGKVRERLTEIFLQDSADELMMDAVAGFANLVVGDDESCTCCKLFLESGTLQALFGLLARLTEIGQKKLTFVCVVAVCNFCKQLTEGNNSEFMEKLANTQLLQGLVGLACQGVDTGASKKAVQCIRDLAIDSAILKNKFVTMVDKRYKPLSDTVKDCLEGGAYRDGVLELVQMYVDYSTNEKNLISLSALQTLVDSDIIQGVIKCLPVENVGENSQEVSARTLISICGGGLPQDVEVETRVKLLCAHSMPEYAMRAINEHYRSEEPLTESILLCAQLLSFTAGVTKRNVHKERFESLLVVCATAGKFASDRVCSLMDELKTSNPLTKEMSEALRQSILPYARLRLYILGCLNSLATCKDNCNGIVKSTHSQDICQMIVNVAREGYDFDIEATRFCVNIVRNLALSNDIALLTALEPFALGDMLQLVSCNSKDVNAANLAAGALRLFCATRDADVLGLLLSEQGMNGILRADLTKVSPIARVELARALSHVIVTLSTSPDIMMDLRRVVITLDCVRFVTFLLQSNQDVLHRESLEALVSCPSEILQLSRTGVTLQIVQNEARVKTRKEQPKLAPIDLESRIRQLEQANPHIRTREIASTVLHKMA